MTKDTGEQFYAMTCREYTLPTDDGSSQRRGWNQGNTKIGPLLEVTTSCLYGKHGVEIRIWSLSEDHLLRHLQQVQRAEDGAVHFWRYKEHLQSQFPQIPYWSDNRWKACLTAGRGAKKRFQYCTDESGINVYLRALQG